MKCKFPDGSRRGVALVIVLSMIVLVTVLVVSFTVNMRTERQASQNMSENERTKLVAESALAHAIGILSSNIPPPAPPLQTGGTAPVPVNWSVSPGLLNLITGPTSVTQIPLSSNPNASYAATAGDANINVLQASSNQYPVLGTADPMCVAWAPLLQNPAQAASAANPLVARYAFWIDDENAKININTAYGKPAGMDYSKLTPGTITETATSPAGTTDHFPLGHPASVNLDVFGSAIDLTKLVNNIKTYGAAKSPDSVKAAVTGADPDTFYQANKFYLTAAGRDPEFNVFGKSRLFMYAGPTGQLDTAAGGGMFQRFRDLDAPMYFHGNENGNVPIQDSSALYYTAASLSSIFNSSQWPGMPAVSFIDKWGKDADGNAFAGLGAREADQIAWNIVAMGSFSDLAYSGATPGQFAKFGNGIPPHNTDPAKYMTGSTGSVNYPNAPLAVGKLSGKAIIPAAPRPMVDEICLNILPQPNDKGTGYYLLFALSYGIWLPPGYPAADFSQTLNDTNKTTCDLFVGMTHLEYTIMQNGGIISKQADSKYINYDLAGVKKGQALLKTGTMAPGQRIQLLSILNNPGADVTATFYDRNGKGFSNSKVGDVLIPPGKVNIDVKLRLYVHNSTPTSSLPTQLIPVWDTHDPGATAAPTTWQLDPPPHPDSDTAVYKTFWPPLDDPHDYVEFNFDLDPVVLSGSQVTRSLWVADPRMGGLSRSWKASWKDDNGNDLPGAATTAMTDSLAAAHNPATEKAITAGWDLNKFAYIDMSATPSAALPHPSVGMFSLVATGMQRGIAGSTFKLQPNPDPAQLPDWLLLDLFAPTVSPPIGSTAWPDIVKMNATAGKINVNGGSFLSSGSFSPPARLLPLKAIFANTPAGAGVVDNIVSHKVAASGNSYPLHSAVSAKFYNYPGEICEIKGVADTGNTDWDKEAVIRNLAGVFTTKSNTFCVWGVAQSIKKLATHTQYDKYEAGDSITGEKRFQAIVERYVWPGADGVAGNGHIDANGKYDSLSQNMTQPGAAPSPAATDKNVAYHWEKLDGPDAPTYPTAEFANTTLNPYNAKAPSDYSGQSGDQIEKANNPLRAVMKYRVISFKYLD